MSDSLYSQSNFNAVFVASTALKLLLIPAYRSTDFEVHRNWLALTHSLPVNQWYFERTSEWTLDYPPFFAYFEWALSQIAKFVDPEMLVVSNLNYASDRTIWFQRISVIVTELGLFFALKRLMRQPQIASSRLMAFSVFLSPGFLIIDHIHFQYNGAMYGLLMYSILALDTQPIYGALLFAVLLCFKHIYLYLAPAYFVYLLRKVVLRSNFKGVLVSRTIKLGAAVILPFAIAFGPFLYMQQMSQVLSRLFPFSRGLCHAYWAPNFWSLYSFLDRVAIQVGPKLNLSLNTEAVKSVTRGLVGDTTFAVLPEISPRTTFCLTLFFQGLALAKLFLYPTYQVFLGALTLCGYASFFFGWHVHEKAILLVILPASLLALKDTRYLFAFRPLFEAGYISLLPLIFTGKEILIVMMYTVAYLVVFVQAFSSVTPPPVVQRRFLMDRVGRVYSSGFGPLLFFTTIIHPAFLSHKENLSFVPLLLTSVYCAWGILWSWLGFNYLYFTDLHKNSAAVKH
ncbi:Dolichyl pyrophosphate Glc1Man9GlcNAc2 alpha-1,3-glucosyltransferase [Taphrina deformans PYCC 5710]|uniref:Alpha-1,3-glucosyltransferase n=1 Tax=Taphrina deformans (strain PYCC 5710 / ATCC 11124 / CBS 356.35 / IMI 108563 / JCM 9778 / NBRC 8474) TaxID=1097556 RepID=R4XHB2_TAPDE|nr:Dolichyl pyrophosphate Glc1Man9GlcNAc2 alpha-1,3-glucosyltransferase [Taphrina deformans PYCC 5710]|eukprot:CCG82797.1 Dolichyl pyrophosphate Glc1Man9GlcNAc2 alpha-1,3-glucosyltransferase [Taphrina deformans PYCC 5710]